MPPARRRTASFRSPRGHPGCTPTELLAGHIQQTANRCRPVSLVVVAQDTVRLDYFTHRACEGLGPVGNCADSRGLFGHSALAMRRDGEPLGLLHLSLWARDPDDYGRRDRRKHCPVEEKETREWGNALRAVEEALPADVPVVLVQDREADVYPFFAQERCPNTDLIVRAYLPRRVELLPEPSETTDSVHQPDVGDKRYLNAAWKEAPLRGLMTVKVPRRDRKPAREARVELRSTRVRVFRSQNLRAAEREKYPPSLDLWAVWVRELNPPKGVEALNWLLLTSLEAATREAVLEVVRLYTLRWRIERLHYVLKSGLKVEGLQIDDATAMMRALAVYWVVAWRILSLLYRSRTEPGEAAAKHLSASELEVLAAKLGDRPETLQEVVHQVARLGGTIPPKGKEPGVKALWQGLRDLHAMVQGWELAKRTSREPLSKYDTC